jgi:ABC-2 type transport system ATP-binding protein
MSASASAGSPTASIECRDLVKCFGSFTAVDHISFSVQPGAVFGFLGPNGSGKSTTIRMLCGLLRPTSGQARVAGIDVVSDPEGVKRQIGYMGQRFSLYGDLTARENLEFYAGIYRIARRDRSARIGEVLELTDTGAVSDVLARELSAGVRQRLALGAALLHRPNILFLDEPTSGVDPISRRRFWTLIDELSAEGVTALVTTHQMDEAEHCSEIVLMRTGRIVARGAPAYLKQHALSGSLLLVVCDRPQSAIRVVAAVPGVQYAYLRGTSIHALTEGDESLTSKIHDELVRNGHRVESIQPAQPTLEDVFVESSRGEATS